MVTVIVGVGASKRPDGRITASGFSHSIVPDTTCLQIGYGEQQTETDLYQRGIPVLVKRVVGIRDKDGTLVTPIEDIDTLLAAAANLRTRPSFCPASPVRLFGPTTPT